MTTKNAQFPTTRWTLVLSAGDDRGRREALDWLCERYWYPIYAYIRRRKHDPVEAQDLTQGFLTAFLQRRSIEAAHPERGRFRSYLLGALKHYLSDCRDYEAAACRGGGVDPLPLSWEVVEERYLQSPAGLSPELLYERQWAMGLIERALEHLRSESAAAGKAAGFDHLKAFLTGEGDYRQAAAALGMNEGAARVAVHRMRRRYRELLMAEIAETVSDPAAIQEEIRHLIEVVAG
jgi:RNA polymerase sigma-70 factor (ECF subfamily)